MQRKKIQLRLSFVRNVNVYDWRLLEHEGKTLKIFFTMIRNISSFLETFSTLCCTEIIYRMVDLELYV